MLTFVSKKYILVFIMILISLIVGLIVYTFKKEICISGKTMGTTYNIKVITGLFTSEYNLKIVVDQRLSEINFSLSTYNSKSEISNFNSIKNTKNKFYPSKDFIELLLFSKKLYKLVGKIWDPSIDPIINAWGFGRDKTNNSLLKHKELDLLLSNVNFDKAIVFLDDGSIRKGLANASIDLASIAKGFGVDQISLLLTKKGFDNFLVEIGGEIYTKGLTKNNKIWQIGINYPCSTAYFNEIYKIIPLSNKAIATSGNYRNFKKIQGEIYSHIIDTKTGYPISNNITSASVIANSCTMADGLATALMLLDPIDSIKLINTLPDIECIVTTIEKNGIFKSYSSNGL